MLKDLCFEIIQTCPNECEFCSSNSSIEKNTIITLEIFKKTITHFINHGGIGEVSISGGEPFFHPDLFEMIKFCKEKGLNTVLFTSGIKRSKRMSEESIKDYERECENWVHEIEEQEPWNVRLIQNVRAFYDRALKQGEFTSIFKEDFEQLKRLGLDKIVFDWQALNEEIDNELMGRKGMITNLISSIIKAVNVGLNVDIHFIPMKKNYKEISDIIECLNTVGVKNISILNFVPQGRGRENKDELMLSEEELKDFSQILNREKESFNGVIRIGIPLNGELSHSCTAGTEKIDIRYDGTILPCPAFKEISIETMERFGINLYSIYDDLEKVVIPGGTRSQPLCRKVYGFTGYLTEGEEQIC